MKITILGNSGPYPGIGSACSGYLLEYKDYKILIDCGNGTLSRLQKYIKSFDELDAIILTHLHSDHIADAMVLRYAIGINKEKGNIEKSIPLYAPMDPQETYVSLQFKDAFIMNKLEETTVLSFDGLRLTFKKMSHPIETYGIMMENEEQKLVYSSDTKLCDNIIELAKNADLLICECGLLERDKSDNIFHLTAKEVGEIATISNTQNLLITHIWPGYKANDLLEEVKTQYKGQVNVAEEYKTYEI